jgi:hypothetical protein
MRSLVVWLALLICAFCITLLQVSLERDEALELWRQYSIPRSSTDVEVLQRSFATIHPDHVQDPLERVVKRNMAHLTTAVIVAIAVHALRRSRL